MYSWLNNDCVHRHWGHKFLSTEWCVHCESLLTLKIEASKDAFDIREFMILSKFFYIDSYDVCKYRE